MAFPAPVGDSLQQDLSSIVVAATKITPLASVSEKGNKREFPESKDVDQRDTAKTPKKKKTKKPSGMVQTAKAKRKKKTINSKAQPLKFKSIILIVSLKMM